MDAFLWWTTLIAFVVLIGGAIVFSAAGILAVLGAVLFRRRGLQGPATADQARTALVDE